MKKVKFITLGCPKNEADSDSFAYILKNSGFEISQEIEEAEILIINTCGFLEEALLESYETYRELRESYPDKEIVLTGCAVERLKGFYEDALFIRPGEIEKLSMVINGKYKADFSASQNFLHSQRIQLKRRVYEYVKIEEGCNRRCAFCTLPFIRGKPRFKSINDTVNEVKALVEEGVREVILVGEDLTLYPELIKMLDKLSNIDGVQLIRLLYLHPGGVKKELIKYFASNPLIARYLHIPIQHVSRRVLRAMRRAGGSRAVYRVIDWVREILPEAFIRTEVIVGFPEEGVEDFEELLRFLDSRSIERVAVFPYSPEPGTFAFFKYGDQVADELSRRYDDLLILSEILQERALNKLISFEKVRVIHDGKERVRTEFDSPEIDMDYAYQGIFPYGVSVQKPEKVDGEVIIKQWSGG